MKIGFIGLGIMGEPMCANIVKKHNDTVYCANRTPGKEAALVAAGALWCESNLQLAFLSDIIITMVPRSEDSEAVYEQILPALCPGKTCIDMSTVDPKVSVRIAQKVSAAGAEFADAPVVKSRPAAEAGTLGIYVGAAKETFERILPVLHYMGENVLYLGGNGRGLVMKICHNALVSQIQNGVNETLTLAASCGIDIPSFAQAVSYGGAVNAYLDTKKNALYEGNYETAFSVENMAKDVGICLDLARERGVYMPGEENAAKVYERALSMGLAREDFCATIKAVRDPA